MIVRVAVFAEPPLPGRCSTKLLAAHSPDWVAGLYAAMLRDTLDGLQSIEADEYLVIPRAGDEPTDLATLTTLERHVPAPWKVVAEGPEPATALVALGGDGATAVVARSDAPSAPIGPVVAMLARASTSFAMLGPTEGGDAWLLGGAGLSAIAPELPWASPELAALVRVRCRKANLPLEELPRALVVDEPSAVLALFDELRRYPERAPRTAHFVATH